MAFTMVEINPNLRSATGETMVCAGDVNGPADVGTEVVVFEPTASIFGRGWITSVDVEADEITIFVDWTNLQVVHNTVAAPVVAPALSNVAIAQAALVAA